MQKIYYECKKCGSESETSHCSKCDSDKDVVLIIFNGINKIPVKYIEENNRKTEPILKIPKTFEKENIWKRLANIRK